MFGKIIGAMVGKRMAEGPGGVSSTGGALLGAGAASVLKRMSPLGLVAAVGGGYLLKRYWDRKQDAPQSPAKKGTSKAKAPTVPAEPVKTAA